MDIHHIALVNSRCALWERIFGWNSRSPEGFSGQSEEADQAPPDGHPEDQELLLPSTLDADRRPQQLADIEIKLRKGQASEYLKALRNQLSQRLVIHREMARVLRGQNNLTRAHSTLDRLKVQINESAKGYRNARVALQRLGMAENDSSYPPLLDSDISTTNVFDNPRPLGRGEPIPISWIWRINMKTEIGDGPQPIGEDWLEEGAGLIYQTNSWCSKSCPLLVLRVQFLDMKVNRDRWKEEVILLEEEIRRIEHYFLYFSERLVERSMQVHGGLAAHLARMSATYLKLAKDVVVCYNQL